MTINGVELDFTMLSNGKYRLNKAITYYSKRYKKYITLPAGMISDGASGPAEDIVSLSWWVHDRLCGTYRWDDGTYCSSWQSSMVMRDILLAEGRYIRANRWFVAVLIYQTYKTWMGRTPKPPKTPPISKVDMSRFPIALA